MVKRFQSSYPLKKGKAGDTWSNIIMNPWIYSGVVQPDPYRVCPTQTHKFKTFADIATVELSNTAGDDGQMIYIIPATLDHITYAATFAAGPTGVIATDTHLNVDQYAAFALKDAHYRVVGCSAKLYYIGPSDDTMGMVYVFTNHVGQSYNHLLTDVAQDSVEQMMMSRSFPIEKGKEYYWTSMPCSSASNKYRLYNQSYQTHPAISYTNSGGTVSDVSGWTQGGFFITGVTPEAAHHYIVETVLLVEYITSVTSEQFEVKKRGLFPNKQYPPGELTTSQDLVTGSRNEAWGHESENQIEHNAIQWELFQQAAGMFLIMFIFF